MKFERLDQDFIDYTRTMVERSVDPEAEMCRESLALYRTWIVRQ